MSSVDPSMTPTPDPLPSGLTPAQALGVALSCGPMTNEAMDKAQAAAVPMLAHLEAMGYALAQPAPALDVERLAREWRDATDAYAALIATGPVVPPDEPDFGPWDRLKLATCALRAALGDPA